MLSNNYPFSEMAEPNAAQIRQQIKQLEQEHGELKTQLAIVRISEPIFSPDTDRSPSKRNSDVSTVDSPSPASLEADLSHYKVWWNNSLAAAV